MADQNRSTVVTDGVEVNIDLLSSFTLVNKDLANDEDLIGTLKRRVSEVENHNDVDLVSALNDGTAFDLVDKANDQAIASILHELGMQDCN